MKKLTKLALESKDYLSFKHEILRFLKWYHVPKHWTFKELKEFYDVTNLSQKFHLTNSRTSATLGRSHK